MNHSFKIADPRPFIWHRFWHLCVVDWYASGVSLKIMRLFRCESIEGTAWLAADMRLQCYTGEWFG